jgi:hypothetical protein
LVCIALLVFLLAWRVPFGRAPRSSLAKLALLSGVEPLWGETNASLRERSTAASRWPFGKPEPRFVWWARAARRIGAELTHRFS